MLPIIQFSGSTQSCACLQGVTLCKSMPQAQHQQLELSSQAVHAASGARLHRSRIPSKHRTCSMAHLLRRRDLSRALSWSRNRSLGCCGSTYLQPTQIVALPTCTGQQEDHTCSSGHALAQNRQICRTSHAMRIVCLMPTYIRLLPSGSTFSAASLAAAWLRASASASARAAAAAAAAACRSSAARFSASAVAAAARAVASRSSR
jgi:hypothetical protein